MNMFYKVVLKLNLAKKPFGNVQLHSLLLTIPFALNTFSTVF